MWRADSPVLCMVTGGRLAGGSGADAAARLLAQIAAAAREGVALVQIREPRLESRALAALVRRAMRAVEGTRARVIVNDRLDVALSSAAHGIHLKESSLPAARVRAVVPPEFIVGRSIHSAAEAADAGVDYLVLGHVFETVSKPGSPPVGLDALREAARTASVPVLAIGGVSAAHLPAVRAAGAAGFAAIAYFDVDPALMHERCSRARQAFDTLPSVS